MVKSRKLLLIGLLLLPIIASCDKSKYESESDGQESEVTTDSVAQAEAEAGVEVDSLSSAERLNRVAISLSDTLVKNKERLDKIMAEHERQESAEIAELKANFNPVEDPDSAKYKEELKQINEKHSKGLKDSTDELLIRPVSQVISAESRELSDTDGNFVVSKSWLDFWKELSILNAIIIVAIFILGALLGFILAFMMRTNKNSKDAITLKKLSGKSIEVSEAEKDFYNKMAKMQN